MIENKIISRAENDVVVQFDSTAGRILLLVMLLCMPATPALASEWETIYPGGNTSCANGEDYLFHVRRGAADKAMLFFNGGGACWNGHMCDPINSSSDMNKGMIYRTRPTAEYGNDPRILDGVFALDNSENPFRDWTQVFVTYCTGDAHLGSRDTVYQKKDGSSITIRHRGRANSQAVMDYVTAEFPGLKQVFVSGASAGGIAAPFYAAEVASRLPEAEIMHFSGGSSGYRLPGAQSMLWDTWGVFENMPQWFDSARYTAKNSRLIDLYFAAAEAFPNIRFHQYDTAYDGAQTMFMKFMGQEVLLYYPLSENQQEFSAGLPYVRSFTAPGSFHTALRFDELYTREVSGVRAVDWVRDIASGKKVDNVHCGTASQCR